MNSFKHFYELASKRARRTAIDDDITRIDPDMSPELHEQVYSILAAFCEYDPSVGYVQNMTFIAILLLEYMTPPQAFHAFVNMLHTDFMAAYVSMNVQEIRLRIKNFLCLLSINLPDVSSHFNHLFLPVDTFLMDYVTETSYFYSYYVFSVCVCGGVALYEHWGVHMTLFQHIE